MLELLAKVDAMAADVEALDRTLRLFCPDIALETIPALQHRPKPDWAIRGQVARKVIDLLREAQGPLSIAEIATQIHGDHATAVHIKRIRKCLDRQRARDTIRGVRFEGMLCWTLSA